MRVAPWSGALRQAPGSSPGARHRKLRRRLAAGFEVRGAPQGGSASGCGPCAVVCLLSSAAPRRGRAVHLLLELHQVGILVREAEPFLARSAPDDRRGRASSVGGVLRRSPVSGRRPSREKRPVASGSRPCRGRLPGWRLCRRSSRQSLWPLPDAARAIRRDLWRSHVPSGRSVEEGCLPRGLCGNGLSRTRGVGERRSQAAFRNAAFRSTARVSPRVEESPPLLLDCRLQERALHLGLDAAVVPGHRTGPGHPRNDDHCPDRRVALS